MLRLALREAVTNIVRHCHATVCHVALLEKDRTIHFTIEDNVVAARFVKAMACVACESGFNRWREP